MADAKKVSPKAILGTAVGWAVGWALSTYSGSNLWVPGVVTVVALVVFNKTTLRPAHFLGAIAVILGHLAWFVVGAVLTETWAPVIFDVVILGAGLVWLWERPGLGPVLTLSIFEVLALANNGFGLFALPVGSVEHRAITVHCTFRALALVALAVGYHNLRKTLVTPETGVAPS